MKFRTEKYIENEVRKEIIKELSSVPTTNAPYMGVKNRPCVDIAVALDIARGKSFDKLTEKEKNEELHMCYGL